MPQVPIQRPFGELDLGDQHSAVGAADNDSRRLDLIDGELD